MACKDSILRRVFRCMLPMFSSCDVSDDIYDTPHSQEQSSVLNRTGYIDEISLHCCDIPVWIHFAEVSLSQSYTLAMHQAGDAVMGVSSMLQQP